MITELESESLIAAVNQLEHSRLLARPRFETVDGRSAQFRSVSEIPVQQLTQTAEGGSIGTTEFRECGITLRITPRVSSDEIMLDINPEVSILADIVDGQPVIDRRSADTTVRVTDGETVLFRGWRSLIDNDLSRDQTKTKQAQTELLIMIKAEVK